LTEERDTYRERNTNPAETDERGRREGDPYRAVGRSRAYDAEGVTGPYGELGERQGAPPRDEPRGYGGSLTVRPQPAPTLGYEPKPGRAETWTRQDVRPWEEAAPRTHAPSVPGRQPGTVTATASSRELHDDIIRDLNAAIAAQGMAAYRYLYLSKWVEGINHGELAQLFADTARGEWQHVEDFMTRVIELGGVPVQSPSDWANHSYGSYAPPPRNPRDIVRILEDSIRSEEEAIAHYEQLASKAMGRDHVTYRLAVSALEDELSDLHTLSAYL